MFRLQENVPEVYVKQSRDFQLISRIFDISNNALRFNVKSTSTILDPMLANERILPLLASRVGFFPKSDYNTHALRLVIDAFPYIVRYKGSKLGIEMAVNTILKAEENYSESKVLIDKLNSKILIYCSQSIIDETLLRDVLSYIIPIGYEIEIGFYKTTGSINTTNTLPVFTALIGKNYPLNTSIVLAGDNINTLQNSSYSDLVRNSIGNMNTTNVLSAEDIINQQAIDFNSTTVTNIYSNN